MTQQHDDQLTGIFDALTPDDFVVETTAVTTMEGCFSGAEVFDGFVEHQLHAVRLAFSVAQGWLTTTAVLASPTCLRAFVADEDETLTDFVARLRHEALRMGAHWSLVAFQTHVGPRDLRTALSASAETPVAVPVSGCEAVVWQATSVEDGHRVGRAGFLPVDGLRLAESLEGPLSSHRAGPLGSVLPGC